LVFITGTLFSKYLPFKFNILFLIGTFITSLIFFKRLILYILIFILSNLYFHFSQKYIDTSERRGIVSIAVIKEQRGMNSFEAWIPYIGNVGMKDKNLKVGETVKIKGKIHRTFYGSNRMYSVKYQVLHIPLGISFIIREKISSFIEKYIPGEEGNFVQAIFLGKRHKVSRKIYNSFKYTGAAHILSISGLHTGIMFFVIFLFLRVIRIKFNTALLIAGIIISSFGVISGLRVPIQRALLFIWLFIIGNITERVGDAINIVSFSALLILILNPLNLYDTGFQLSFISVYGIVLFWRNIHYIIFRWGRNRILNEWITYPFSISLAAQISTIPVVIVKFHYIAVLGTLSNLVIIPLTGLLLSSILLMLFLFPFVSFLSYPVWWIAHIIIKTAGAFASFPLSAVFLYHFPEWGFFIYYPLIFFLLNVLPNRYLKSS